QADAGVAGRSFDDHAAGAQLALGFGIPDYGECGTVLHRPPRVEEFGLAENLASGLLGQPAQADERRVADRPDKPVSDIHRRLRGCTRIWRSLLRAAPLRNTERSAAFPHRSEQSTFASDAIPQPEPHMQPLSSAILPQGIRSRFVEGVNGLTMHVLEAGWQKPARPCVLLLHGFPEIAYSWRKVMLPLADAGYYVVAPDQRGYGRTTGWDDDYDGDLRSFRLLNLVRDSLGLVSILGHRSVAAVVGHDFGASVAAWCALARPDVFRSVVLMSAPFAGPPPIPFGTDGTSAPPVQSRSIHDDLAALERPRKHYQWYYSSRPANRDMVDCPQGVAAFLRAYFHHKSADWKQNRPFPLAGWTATELAKM